MQHCLAVVHHSFTNNACSDVGAGRLVMQMGRKPTSIVGRYNCTYNNIYKPQWWDTLKSGGCIVEQATHFVDAMRYLSGSEFRKDSIQALGVGPDMELSDMPPPPNAEHTVRTEIIDTQLITDEDRL